VREEVGERLEACVVARDEEVGVRME